MRPEQFLVRDVQPSPYSGGRQINFIMWLKTALAPHTQAVEQTLPPSPEVIAQFKDALPTVYRRVLAHAILIVRRKRWARGSVMPEGKEAQDLVQEAIRRVLDGSRRWNPDKVPSLEFFLKEVVRSIASDLVVSPENRVDGIHELTESKTFALPQALQYDCNAEKEMENAERYQELADKVMSAACEDPLLEKIVQAMLDGCAKPEEIVLETGLEVVQVYAGMKKIRRRLDSAAKRRAS